MEPYATFEWDKRIQLPAHALFVGASMSGKTRLVMRLLQDPSLFNPPPKSIIFFYDQFQAKYLETQTKLAKLGINLQLRRGHDVKLDDLPQNDHQTLVIVDDASDETAASKEILRIATNGRHKNISLWLIWHSLFSRHPTSRVICQNMGLYFFLPSMRLESQLRTFGAQLGIQDRLMVAYKRCVNDQLDNPQAPPTDHRYLLVDLTNDVPDLLRLRSHIHQPVQYCYA